MNQSDVEASAPSPSRTTSFVTNNEATSKAKEAGQIQVLDWDGPNDPTNPYNWSPARKWLVAGTALVGTLIVPLNGTSITVAAAAISEEFNVNDGATFTNTYWTVTSWSIGGAVFVIVFLPLMEDLGVRRGYLVFYLLFLLMVIPQAVAQNFATLVVTRFFSGGCVALLANTISSVIPDIWAGAEARSVPVGLYILLYLVGSTLGPPMFAGVTQHIGNWRCAFLPFFVFMIRETRGNVILRRRAQTLRKRSGKPIYTQAELDAPPLRRRLLSAIARPSYLLVTEPVVFACTMWSAFSFGTVFLFTQSVEQVFISLYDWPDYSTGYVQGAVIIGEILGWLATLYSSHLYLASARRNSEDPGHPIPEARLYVSIPASFIGLTGGMFVYAWTSYPELSWIAPAIGLAMVGFGIQVVVSSVADYVTDAYAASDYAASAISAVAAGENTFAAFLPLAAQSMYGNLGLNWASTLLGFLALILSFAPILFVWKGVWFRARSPFMLGGQQKRAVHEMRNEVVEP
nr:putative mfs-type transporter [Quercus suber]